MFPSKHLIDFAGDTLNKVVERHGVYGVQVKLLSIYADDWLFYEGRRISMPSYTRQWRNACHFTKKELAEEIARSLYD